MAHSAGFRPHPKISYANAVPTGVASHAEYLEIGVARPIVGELLTKSLDAALPSGVDVVDAVEAVTGGFAARLQASIWRVDVAGIAGKTVESAVERFNAAEWIEVERATKRGMRRFDVRGSVAGLQTRFDPRTGVSCAILDMVVTHGTPSVRPDDVLTALMREGKIAPPQPSRITRLAQGQLAGDGWEVSDPLAPDRAGSQHAET